MDPLSQIEHLIAQGRYLEARFAADELRPRMKEPKLDQLYGLALSKSGLPEEALSHLEPLYKSDPNDPETAGILGSIYKELFKKNKQTSFARLSRDTYFKNFSITKNYYTGINAASMSAIIMEGARSREIAGEIIDLIDPETEDFWQLATLGEACLIRKDTGRAVQYYLSARKAAGDDWGKISSVYNQLWLLNHYIPVSREAMKIFNPPGVVAFVGHMIDHPSRSAPRFPPNIETQIKNVILTNLNTINAHIGFCSAACGSDILFAEAMAELGREVNIFLPFAIDDFIETSVAFAGNDWVRRFRDLIEKHPVRLITEERYEGFDMLFNFQSKVIFGSAILRSLAQQNKTTLLTVLSETDLKKRVGGTGYSISIWPRRDGHVNINPDIFVGPAPRPAETEMIPDVKPAPNRKVLHLIAINAGMLLGVYREKFLRALEIPDKSEFVNIDAGGECQIYAFESEFMAIELLRQAHAAMRLLPQDQQVSISLHSGVCFVSAQSATGDTVDTIIEMNRLNQTGICVSEHVAALLALQLNKFTITYSGTLAVKKGKNLGIYRVTVPLA